MSISPSDANLARLHLDQQNAIQKKMDMDGLRKSLETAPNKAAKLREACEGFESIFIQKIWEQMRANVEKSGYLHSRDEQMYQGMYDMEFSKKLTQAGGIGLADMLYEQLAQRLGESSRSTTPRNNPRLPILPAGSSLSGGGLEPKPLRELEANRSAAGIPLNNQLKPLYENVPASHVLAAEQLKRSQFQNLVPFDDSALEEQVGLPAGEGQAALGGLDLESASLRLLEEELAGQPEEAEQKVATVGQETALSPEESSTLEAALLQNLAEAGRIIQAQAPAASVPEAAYARLEQAMKMTRNTKQP